MSLIKDLAKEKKRIETNVKIQNFHENDRKSQISPKYDDHKKNHVTLFEQGFLLFRTVSKSKILDRKSQVS